METITRKWIKSIDDRAWEHEAICPNNKYYNRLRELQDNYPDLTYQNQGYDYPKINYTEQYPKQLEEINAICRDSIQGFSKFNHFKLRKDGSFVLRVQYAWSRSFTGVGYFLIDYWNEQYHAACVRETEQEEARLAKIRKREEKYKR